MPTKTYCLERTQIIRRPREEVFAFFADAGNLEAITPEFLGFRILTPRPIPIESGTLIDYRIRLFGIPLKWRTRIDEFDAPHRFSDVQERGPYAFWHHSHEFHDAPEGTKMVDRVAYRIPLGPLGRFAHGLFVRRMLEKIFDYRRETIDRLFPPLANDALPSAVATMKP